ncbi:hypothetical protein Hte_010641 [Hypoxylon texense]
MFIKPYYANTSIDRDVFPKANEAMGLRMNADDGNAGVGAFSEDILKIEISGPEEILQLAEAADPEGVRTMGVLTKPDLASEKATQNMILDLVLGRRNKLTLGYCIVKNRSADDNTSTMSERHANEKAFFTAPPWASVADRCGIASLQARLRELLMDISKRELPHVRAEIEKLLHLRKLEIDVLGAPRADQVSQRLFLVKIASKFQGITENALYGYYTGNQIFKSEPSLKLATRMMQLNESWSNVFLEKAHKRHFDPEWDDDGAIPTHTNEQHPSAISLTKYPELFDIICTDEYDCPNPSKGPIIDHVKEVFKSNRGPELGTFGGAMLAAVFQEQLEKWEPLALSHTSTAIVLVHEYICQLLDKLCPDTQVKDQLWSTLLEEKLKDAYRQAISHANFLLAIEREEKPVTFNHYFNANLQKRRIERISKSFKDIAVSCDNGNDYIPLKEIEGHAINKDNAQQVCEDIVDTLMSYYKVSRKRFVDTLCQQVVNHFLLYGNESPLKALSPESIMSLEPDQLELIAGEDTASKRQRQVLAREIKTLEDAIQELRA